MKADSRMPVEAFLAAFAEFKKLTKGKYSALKWLAKQNETIAAKAYQLDRLARDIKDAVVRSPKKYMPMTADRFRPDFHEYRESWLEPVSKVAEEWMNDHSTNCSPASISRVSLRRLKLNSIRRQVTIPSLSLIRR